jgi:hypothetical protein
MLNKFTKQKQIPITNFFNNYHYKETTEYSSQYVSNNIVNRGTGAGGANTNKNGLDYESLTQLSNMYYVKKCTNDIETIQFPGSDTVFVNGSKSKLYDYMESKNKINKNIVPASGCKKPDEAFINETCKIIYIIEKKFQQGSGSVDEKIQTGEFKKYHYEQLFPEYKIEYIYCLSDWFKRSEYRSVIEFLGTKDIPIFWGSDNEYKEKIVSYMLLDNTELRKAFLNKLILEKYSRHESGDREGSKSNQSNPIVID